MEGIYQHYIIDLSSNNNFVQIPTMQGDGNGVRGVELELIKNNTLYNIDTSTTGVYIAGAKPDNKHILNDCVVSDEGYVLVDITSQMSASPGIGYFTIMLINKEKNSKIDAFPFNIITTASPYDIDYITSSDEYQALTKTLGQVSLITEEAIEKIQQVDTLAQQWQIAEDARASNENIRILNEISRETNENQRNSDEVTRVQNEITRQQNEVIREQNEDTRKQEELLRDTSETIRTQNEIDRKNEEAIRNANEKTRDDSEKSRVQNEQTRNQNELTRINSELARETQEDEREKNATNLMNSMQSSLNKTAVAITNAENATNRANELSEDLEFKLESGYFKGEKGDDGVIATIDSIFAFEIENGHLMLHYADDVDAPDFYIDESSGHLMFELPS